MTPEPVNPDYLPAASWMERKTAAGKACAALTQNPGNTGLAGAVRAYAADSKWEVRKAVAEALAFLPEDVYNELVAALHSDHNAFVRSAALRSVEKRTPVSNMVEGVPGRIQQAYEKMVSKHGPEVAQDVVNFTHIVTERHLRTAVHDIKNILTNFSLDVEALRKLAPGQKRKLERYERGCAYLKNLSDMMAKYSEPLDITLAPESLAEMIRASIASAVTQIREEGRPVDGVKLPEVNLPDEVHVSVSRYHLEMVLTNLIKNGIQAHAVSATEMKPGFVSVKTEIRDDAVLVTVTDGGRGIAPADLAKLREFIPGGSSKRRDRSGTGYGLPICRRYVEAHGGTLTIQSKEGEGTSVSFRLPIDANHH